MILHEKSICNKKKGKLDTLSKVAKKRITRIYLQGKQLQRISIGRMGTKFVSQSAIKQQRRTVVNDVQPFRL